MCSYPDVNSQEYANGRYLSRIPMRFRRASGVDRYDFKVQNPWHRPYSYIVKSHDGVESIPQSAYCAIWDDSGLKHVLIPAERAPKLFEALILVGRTLFCSVRVEKYLTMHKAYECVSSSPSYELSAVRHSLAHAGSRLTRAQTVGMLMNMFGSVTIDFEKHAHVRKYYECLGRLFVETDKLLYSKVVANVSNWISIPSERHALHDWQVQARGRESVT